MNVTVTVVFLALLALVVLVAAIVVVSGNAGPSAGGRAIEALVQAGRAFADIFSGPAGPRR